MTPAPVDVVAVLVDHGVGDRGAPPGGNDHHATVPLAPSVAAGRPAATALAELVPVDDPDRDALDLVRVRRTPKETGVPPDLDVGADVEAHRPAFAVAQDDLARRGGPGENGGGEDGEHRDDERPCHAPTGGTSECRPG